MVEMKSPLDHGALRERLRTGAATWGTFLGLGAPIAAEIAAAAGMDWVLLDLEHGAGGEELVYPTIAATGGYGVPTVVRVESDDRIRIGRVLDAGAAGVMVPRVESAEQVRNIVANFHFPPTGHRGVASYNRAAQWGLDPAALMSPSSATVIIQIETRGALEHVTEIAATPGVDVLFVGPLDLSFALGVPRDFESDTFTEALRTIVTAAHNNGIVAGILAPTPAAARRYRAMGFTFIALASDSVLLANIITSSLTELQEEQP